MKETLSGKVLIKRPTMFSMLSILADRPATVTMLRGLTGYGLVQFRQVLLAVPLDGLLTPGGSEVREQGAGFNQRRDPALERIWGARQAGDVTQLRFCFLPHQRIRETPVSGGDICAASRLTLDDGHSVFAKTWPEGMLDKINAM